MKNICEFDFKWPADALPIGTKIRLLRKSSCSNTAAGSIGEIVGWDTYGNYWVDFKNDPMKFFGFVLGTDKIKYEGLGDWFEVVDV